MGHIKTITHMGKSIVCSDLTNFNVSDKRELQEAINETKDHIAKQPPGSVLIITNVNQTHFDMEIIKMFIEYTSHNKPYIKASAVIGITGLLNIALNSVIKNTLRDIHTFDTEAQALDWLVEQ
ncbi:MAG TPA: hypothetical protein VHY08_22240 [Bacillota bacterium]|nr:hypothetical protein [Bacillota bacterium]